MASKAPSSVRRSLNNRASRREMEKRKLSFQRRVGSGIEALEDRRLMAADFIENEVLVQYLPNVSQEQREQARVQVGLTLLETIHTGPMKASNTGVLERVGLPAFMNVSDAVAWFNSQATVDFAEPNFIYTTSATSNDPQYTNGSLWGMYSDDLPSAVGPVGTTNQFGSAAEKAWNAGFTRSDTVYVGVIDTGVDISHPDLNSNIWVNPFDPVNGVDDDGNGLIDDTAGWDFANNDRSVFDNASTDAHGTHVAGTVGATGNNAVGVAGVNWDVTIISGKFLNPSGSTANAIKAVDYFTDLKMRHGLNIVATNNSWGGGGASTALHQAIIRGAKQDILFIAAAGNSASNNDVTNNFPSNYRTKPGAGSETGTSYEGVIAVANITASGTLSGTSSFGLTTVDLGAPGTNILSTTPGNTYQFFSGTSMASPHVAGAAALYAARYGNVSAEEIRDALLTQTVTTPSLVGRTVTGGRLNVFNTINDDPISRISVGDETIVEGDSGVTVGVFTVTLSRPSTEVVTVEYRTTQGTATDGVDYIGVSGTLTFDPGITSQEIIVPVIGDTDVEVLETFTLILENPQFAELKDGIAIGSIFSEDLPAVSIEDAVITEGNSGTKVMTFPVRLSAASSVNVVLFYETLSDVALAGSDFARASGILTIPAGATGGSIRVNVFGDNVVEKDETFFVVVYDSVGLAIGDGIAVGTINNDDFAPTVNVANGSVIEGNTGKSFMNFTFTLSAPSPSYINVNYRTTDGTATVANADYDRVTGVASFAPGRTSVRVQVPIRGDRRVEADEFFFLDLMGGFNAILATNRVLGVIINDDSSLGSVNPPPGLLSAASAGSTLDFDRSRPLDGAQLQRLRSATESFVASIPNSRGNTTVAGQSSSSNSTLDQVRTLALVPASSTRSSRLLDSESARSIDRALLEILGELN